MLRLDEYRKLVRELRHALVHIKRCMIYKVLNTTKPGEDLILHEFKAYFGPHGYSIDIQIDSDTCVEIKLDTSLGCSFTIKLFTLSMLKQYLLSDIHLSYDNQIKFIVRDYSYVTYAILELDKYWAKPYLESMEDGM